MKIEASPLPEVKIVRPQVFEDARGFFLETYHERKFSQQGLRVRFVQDNLSRSERGTVRGLHFQNPRGQGKLVRVVVGAVYDVALDVRRGSPTFGKWVGMELTAENKLSVYIPAGFAHGFCVMSHVAEFFYKCTDFYVAECEHGILWNDPQLAIRWPVEKDKALVSEKDGRYPPLAGCKDVLPVYRGPGS